MALPTSYMAGSFSKIPSYFDTLLTAKAPDKFTTKFMSDLGYTSSNDRQQDTKHTKAQRLLNNIV